MHMKLLFLFSICIFPVIACAQIYDTLIIGDKQLDLNYPGKTVVDISPGFNNMAITVQSVNEKIQIQFSRPIEYSDVLSEPLRVLTIKYDNGEVIKINLLIKTPTPKIISIHDINGPNYFNNLDL